MVIFHAGSLTGPFSRLSALFERRNPGVKILGEAAGSRECARKMTESGRICDVFGSSDYRVIEDLFPPRLADFNILFATNEMTIAFTDASKEASRVTASNWHQVLQEDQVRFGRSDPAQDPCGYRTLMLFQLAERYYRVPGLAAALEKRHGEEFIRRKETDLVPLLTAGDIDYLFIYKSVAVQHGLRSLELPGEINLGREDQAALYESARVKIAGRRGTQIEVRGEPIFYSVTIPKNAQQPDVAAAWVALLLSTEGQAILKECGQQWVAPAPAYGYENLPESLSRLCRPVTALCRD